MHEAHDCLLGDTRARLLGDRALWLPDHRALLIADLHLGKADAFRRAGIGLPRGGTAHDLARLDALLAGHDAGTLWILGDVLHGEVFDAAWRRHWSQWRAQRAGVDIIAVRGNHDRALPAADLGIHDAGSEAALAGLRLRHDPAPSRGAHVVCGHLHPLCEPAGLRRRFPAFWLRDGMTVLPAFSQFTAGVVPTLQKGEQLVACVEGAAIPLPPAR